MSVSAPPALMEGPASIASTPSRAHVNPVTQAAVVRSVSDHAEVLV